MVEGVPQIRKIAIHQDHPDNQSPVVEDVMDEKSSMEAEDGIMSGDDKIEGLPTVEKSQREGALYFDIRFMAIIPQSGDNAIRLLSKMFSINRTYEEKIAALSDEFRISVTKEMSKEVLNVCNLSTGVYNKGRQEGRMEEKREMALSLSKMGIPVDKIAEAAKVSLETVQKWLSGNVGVAK